MIAEKVVIDQLLESLDKGRVFIETFEVATYGVFFVFVGFMANGFQVPLESFLLDGTCGRVEGLLENLKTMVVLF